MRDFSWLNVTGRLDSSGGEAVMSNAVNNIPEPASGPVVLGFLSE